jgi:hypothetical protein
MLNAITHGKGRHFQSDISAGDSLRKAFLRSEDMLTATIFERLAYLSGPVVWQILGLTFRPRFLPSLQIVQLEEIEFWPTWSEARGRLGKSVIPDVVLRLSAGDPPRSLVLIVECKLDGSQDPNQWAEEWIAHADEYPSSQRPDEVWLLALGGRPPLFEGAVARFVAEIHRNRGVEIQAAAGDWTDLLRALDNLDLSAITDRRIVLDIRQALDLFGYRTFSPMSELGRLAADYAIADASIGSLRWHERPKALGSLPIDR